MRTHTPVVFVDRPSRGIAVDAVLATNVAGAAAGVRHLAAAGHRRIAHLGDLGTLPTAQEHFQGYRETLLELGIPMRPEYVVPDQHSVDAAASAVGGLFDAAEPPTALFTSQNLVTIGAIRALRQRGRQHDVALVGFDDFPVADLLEPGVTVIAQDPAAMGRMAAELVFQRLDAEQWRPVHHLIETRLLPRGSGEIPPPP